MKEIADEYPGYEFEKNVGYGTKSTFRWPK